MQVFKTGKVATTTSSATNRAHKDQSKLSIIDTTCRCCSMDISCIQWNNAFFHASLPSCNTEFCLLLAPQAAGASKHFPFRSNRVLWSNGHHSIPQQEKARPVGRAVCCFPVLYCPDVLKEVAAALFCDSQSRKVKCGLKEAHSGITDLFLKQVQYIIVRIRV